MLTRILLIISTLSLTVCSQTPAGPSIEPGVSHDLAKWRAANYSDVRYKLNLTLEKMSPVLRGTIEIRVDVLTLPRGVNFTNSGLRVNNPGTPTPSPTVLPDNGIPPIIIDWRKIAGHEKDSTIKNVTVNGQVVRSSTRFDAGDPDHDPDERQLGKQPEFTNSNEHLIFSDGVKAGENVIKLDFTSPILTSGSAITRYVDKEDGAEYIYSLFVPSDASTAFPVFDQPDLKARFSLDARVPIGWRIVSNGNVKRFNDSEISYSFGQTEPISTYVFAFAAGPWAEVSPSFVVAGALIWTYSNSVTATIQPPATAADYYKSEAGEPLTSIYVRQSQAAKFKPHAAEVFRLNREGIKYLETYFDYKFPFPKYDIVLIPEFPFGGMEHAGATFLREASVIFPQEPTKNDYISRANVIFHEAAHQWFGDTVTMKWFDDLWLKEGFAEFMAYKTLEKVQGGNPTGREGAPRAQNAGQMPEVNAWKVFYERNKQAAYLTDSTKGTTPIYQEIANLNSAKSAYGNIVYRKAPSFLKQAEFYLGPDKFQTAVRAFLKKHEYANAGWEDLVKEFENVRVADAKKADFYSKLTANDQKKLEEFTRWSIRTEWAEYWVEKRSTAIYRVSPKILDGTWKLDWLLGWGSIGGHTKFNESFSQQEILNGENYNWLQNVKVLKVYDNGDREEGQAEIGARRYAYLPDSESKRIDDLKNRKPDEYVLSSPKKIDLAEAVKVPKRTAIFVFPNYQDYGYGIFLLDDKSRDYVLKNIQNEKDDFLRTMMWGSLWDSVREAELAPKDYVELVIKNLSSPPCLGGVPEGRGGSSGNSTVTAPCNENGSRRSTTPAAKPATPPNQGGEQDESTIATLLNRVSTAMRYYMSEPPASAGGTHAIASPTSGPTLRRTTKTTATPPAHAGGSDKTADLNARLESLLIDRMQHAPTPGQRITYYRAFLGLASSDNARNALKQILNGPLKGNPKITPTAPLANDGLPTLRTKDKFDIVTRLMVLGDADAPRLLAQLEKTETSDEARRYAYAARAGMATPENKAKYWNDFTTNKDISESWIEAAFVPFNATSHADLTLPYLERALAELPNLKLSRKIFFVNGWLAAFIGGQRSEQALAIINKFLADNPNLDKDLRLKILENSDLIERAVKIRGKFKNG